MSERRRMEWDEWERRVLAAVSRALEARGAVDGETAGELVTLLALSGSHLLTELRGGPPFICPAGHIYRWACTPCVDAERRAAERAAERAAIEAEVRASMARTGEF